MRVLSLLASVHPLQRDAVEAALSSLPGVTLHGEAAPGKLVVLVEGADGDDLMPTVSRIQHLPGVLATMLTYDYCDDTPAPSGAQASSQADSAMPPAPISQETSP